MSLGSRIGQADQQHLTTLDLRYLKITSNLSDLNNVVTARSNLGLGSLAVENIDTTALTSYLKLTGSLAEVTNHSHTVLTDIGTNTHAQIDSHISDASDPHGSTLTQSVAVVSPLIIGGTSTTSDLTLQTTSGIGATGADMHFLVGNNGATEAMTILNNGNVGIGTVSPNWSLEVNGAIVSGPGANTDFNVKSRIMTWANDAAYYEGAVYSSAAASDASGFLFSRARGTYAEKAAVTTDDRIFFIVGRGYDGTTFQNPVAITGKVDGAVSSGVVPGRLAFETSPDSSANREERLVIKSDGKIGIGISAPKSYLHLKGGSASAENAPLKFTEGTNLTTPESGAVEWNGTNLFITQYDATRKTLAFTDSAISSTTYVGTTAIALNRASAAQSLTGITSIDGNAATVTTNANLTGPITSAGNATSIASQTGTGTKFVVDTSPTLVTPILGVASATSLAVPALTTASGAMSITPAAGSNLNIALSTTGDLAVNTSQLYVDTSEGNVGIGVTTPANTLDIVTGSASKGILISDNKTDATVKYANIQGLPYTNTDGAYTLLMGYSASGANTVRFGGGTTNAKAATSIVFYTAANTTTTKGTERLTIDSSGNVGIGTTGPAARLEVNETTAATSANVFITARQENELRAQMLFRTKNSVGGLTGGSIGSSGSRGSELAFMGTTGGIGTPHMVLDSSGRLGIGNTDPGFPLTITNTNVTNGQLELRSQRVAIAANNVLGGIEFRSDDTSLAAPGTIAAAMRVIAAGSHTATNLNTAFEFYVTDSNATTLTSYPALYIQPSNLVDLRRDSTNTTAFGTAHFRLQNLDATAATNHLINVRFDFYDTTGGTNRNAGGIIIGKEQAWTTTASTRDSFMSLHTSLDGTVTEQVRITSAGNVGIGKTVPAAARLHIGTAVSSNYQVIIDTPAGNVSANGLGIAIDDGATAGHALRIVQTTDGVWATGTPTELFEVTYDGKVGIGEAAPDYKLDVNGSFGFTPGTTVTPVDNGDVTVAFTNNTTLTFSGKGTDGSVRTATLTLA